MVELGPLFFILAFFLGASFGSFACAAASRTEAGVKWWGRERSRCDGCGAVLAPRDLVPVLSFLALRGRCRFCGARIPLRCPASELACGLLCALFLWRFGASYSFIFSSASLPFLAFHTPSFIPQSPGKCKGFGGEKRLKWAVETAIIN